MRCDYAVTSKHNSVCRTVRMAYLLSWSNAPALWTDPRALLSFPTLADWDLYRRHGDISHQMALTDAAVSQNDADSVVGFCIVCPSLSVCLSLCLCKLDCNVRLMNESVCQNTADHAVVLK